MPSIIVCTTCSREKDTTPDRIPARDRYLGSHIKIAEQAAKADKLPLYFLSGKYGLVPAGQVIPYYDYLLDQTGVTNLISKLCTQLNQSDVHEVRFYVKNKPAWKLYRELLEAAASVLEIQLTIHELPDDA